MTLRIYKGFILYPFICCCAAFLPANGQTVAEESSDVDTSYLREVRGLLQDNVYVEAIRRLETWLQGNSDDTYARKLICQAYEDTEDFFRLRHHARILVQKLPGDSEAQDWLNQAQLKIEEEYPAKLQELETALAADPQNHNIRRELINLYLLGDRKDDAVREFKILLAANPENKDLLLEYARNLAWMDRLELSISAYQRYIDMVGEPSLAIRLEQARAYAWNEQYREAISILNLILDEDPEFLDASALLGDIYRWNDDSVAAESFYSFVLERDSEHSDAHAGMRALEEMERTRMQASGTLSIPEMKRRVQENPDDAEALRQLARLYAAKNDYASAIDTYERYLELRPDNTPVFRDYAFCLSMEQRYDDAIFQLRRYLEAFPEDITVRLDIINMLSWSERYDQAKEELLDIFSYSSLYPEIIWQLARIEHIQGHYAEAISYYQQLEQTAPHYSVAEANIREIESLPSYRLSVLEARVAENPDDLESRLSLAIIYLEAERYWEARDQAKSVLLIEPNNVEAERIVGWSDIGIEELRYEQLLEYRARLRKDPDDAEAALGIARILRQDQNFEDAVRFYRAYLSQHPQDDEVLEEYVMTMYWTPGYEKAAAEELRRLLDFRPDDINLHLLYLDLMKRRDLLQFDEFEMVRAIEAELDYRMALEPENPMNYYWFGRLRQIRGDVEKALELYYYASNNLPRDAEVKAEIGERIQSIEGSTDYRINRLSEYTAQNPASLNPLLDLAYLQYDSERYYEARETCKQILELDPGNPDALDMLRASDGFIRRLRSGELNRLRYEVTQSPSNVEAQLELARILRQEGSYEEARERYRIYLRSYPSDSEARREYAQMLSWTENHRDEAIVEMRQLIQLNPQDYELQLQLARVMSWDRRYWPEAERRLERLSRLAGEEPEIMILQADLHRYQGRLKLAESLYDRVLEMTGHTSDYYARQYREENPEVEVRRRYPEERITYRKRSEPIDAVSTYEPYESYPSVDEDEPYAHKLRPVSEARPQANSYDSQLETSVYEEVRSARDDGPIYGPLYYRDPDLYEYTENSRVPSDQQSLNNGAKFEHDSLLAQRVGTQSAAAETYEGKEFRPGALQSVDDSGLQPSSNSDRTEVITTDEEAIQAQPRNERTRNEGPVPQSIPQRSPEVPLFSQERSNIPEVRRPDLNSVYRETSPTVSFRRRDLTSRPMLNQSADEPLSNRYRSESSRPVASANEFIRTEPRVDSPPRIGRSGLGVESNPYRENRYEPRGVVYRGPERSSYSGDSRISQSTQPDMTRESYRTRSLSELRQPYPSEPDSRANPYRVDPVSRYGTRQEVRDLRRMSADSQPDYPNRESEAFNYERPYGSRFASSTPRYQGELNSPQARSRYDQTSYRSNDYRPEIRSDYYERNPYNRYQEPVESPRYDSRYRSMGSPSQSSVYESRRMDYRVEDRNNYVPPVGRRMNDQAYDTRRTEYSYDRYGNSYRTGSYREPGFYRDAEANPGMNRRPVREQVPVIDELRSNRQRFYGPVETEVRPQPRRVVAAPPEQSSAPERPVIQLQPVGNMTGAQQVGDTRSASYRVSPRYDAAVALDPSAANYAMRAEEGLRTIREQMRPQVALFLGVEEDSDDFSGHRLGGRYSHFFGGGNRFDLGLTYYEYNEDSGLSINDSIEATMLSLGLSSPLGDRMSGSVQVNLTDYSIDPDFSVTGSIGASFAVDPVNSLALDYEYYDTIHTVKTIRSLEEDITADRIRLSWNSNPLANQMYREFWQRIYFEGNVSYTSYSDSNNQLAFLLRPYFRIFEDPALDFVMGYRSLAYDFESPFYWSPDSYSGPLFGLRIAGQTIWEILYEIRAEIFFPTSAQTSRSLSIDLRKNFTENFSIGGSLFLTQSPREDDSTYEYYGLLLDMLYRF